ncbi:hypothetical protein BTA51_06775 [Hahella sp. CCB-MM4]|uniref:DUF3592 domain-containing protein n=1 Tax=Hahella sp. (strain CCB-MM4) TaxID=1926491 RepID=UPI000BD9C631|nr:DUF3592 domain-containing protein [Hahella sp. CCB-MM4]OZG74681.1 hypothetical protein BTA51_06775 [Hahella sp. CCB-MM4]
MKTPLPILFGSLIFGIAGLFILYFGLDDLADTWQFLENAASATGTVENISTQYSEMGSGSNKTRNWTDIALIRYSPESGTTVRFEHAYGLIEGPLQEGVSVSVAYQPEQPQEARINSFSALWAGDIALLFMGGMFLAAGYAVYRVFGKP